MIGQVNNRSASTPSGLKMRPSASPSISPPVTANGGGWLVVNMTIRQLGQMNSEDDSPDRRSDWQMDGSRRSVGGKWKVSPCRVG